jgi:hypothetical protein
MRIWYKNETDDSFIKNLNVDKREKKLLLYLKKNGAGSLKPQEIVRQIFCVENPVYAMAREKILG